MKQRDLGFDTKMERAFLKRTAQCYRNLVARLAEKRDKNDRIVRRGRTLPFTMLELRGRLRPQFDDFWETKCTYCQRVITAENFQPEHAVPLARGGDLTLTNIVPSCEDCNRIKGQLLPFEFKALRDGLRTFSEAAQRDILGRLRGQMKFLGYKKSKPEATQSPCQQK